MCREVEEGVSCSALSLLLGREQGEGPGWSSDGRRRRVGKPFERVFIVVASSGGRANVCFRFFRLLTGYELAFEVG